MRVSVRTVHESAVDPVALRRGVLAVSVLDDIPLEPSADGVRLRPDWHDPSWTTVPWGRLEQALAGAAPESREGRLRLRDWFRVRAVLARDGAPVRTRAVALALPCGHALHPGRAWVREPVLGGVLDLGLGLRVDSPVGEQSVLALAPSALACAGIDARHWWAPVRERLDALAVLAIERLTRDGAGLLTPMGGCDVLTLLGSRWLRAHLAAGDGTGMRAIAAPMRTRAWFDLARIDPAFVAAAAAATDEEHRGVPRPLLVTCDEVVLASPANAGRLAELALRDPAGPDPLLPDVLYR